MKQRFADFLRRESAAPIPERPAFPAHRAPVVRPVDRPEDDEDLLMDAAALAQTLASQSPESVEHCAAAERPRAKVDRGTLLRVARFGESARQDLGLTARESRRVEKDPFMARLDKLT